MEHNFRVWPDRKEIDVYKRQVIQSQGISQSSVDFPANPDITAGQFKQSVRTGDPGKNTFTVHITEFPDGQVRGDDR